MAMEALELREGDPSQPVSDSALVLIDTGI